MPNPVILSPHNPSWALEFLRVRKDLLQILQDIPIISIEHVGSTSIPNLLAKPVLDIDIVVTSSTLPATRAALVQAGYTDLGDLDIPDRIAFRQPRYEESDGEWKEMRRNTYVIVEGSTALRNHRDLKRILNKDERLRREYGEVKRGLVEGGVKDVDEYCRGKSEMLLRILGEAGWGEVELEEVRRANEWFR